MSRGKEICKTLKAIRKQVADANGIEYEPTECTHKGDCAGTCPSCEQEVRYIERQLNIRRMLGKAVSVAGISMGMAALTGCHSSKMPLHKPLAGDVPYMDDRPLRGKVPSPPSDTQQQEGSDSTQQAKTMVMESDTISEPVLFGMPAQTMPTFRGGADGLKEWIEENIQYPDGFSGNARVLVRFTVQEDGTVSDAKVLQSISPELDTEALRLVSIMPKWNPGRIGDHAEPMTYIVPIVFKTE